MMARPTTSAPLADIPWPMRISNSQ